MTGALPPFPPEPNRSIAERATLAACDLFDFITALVARVLR